MARSVRSNKGTSASASQLGDRFAKMSLTPTSQSQGHVNKNKNKKKKAYYCSMARRISSEKEARDKLANTYNAAGNEAIPYVLYFFLSDATRALNRSGWPNKEIVGQDLRDLAAAEYMIDVVCSYFKGHLPLCWKYDREHANSLIAGYDKTFFADNGIKWII